MKLISEPEMLVADLAENLTFVLSGANVEDGGHCKYCINVDNYCN